MSKRFLPWEAYHRAVRQAAMARARFVRDALLQPGGVLKRRICAWAKRRHIPFCPLCC